VDLWCNELCSFFCVQDDAVDCLRCVSVKLVTGEKTTVLNLILCLRRPSVPINVAVKMLGFANAEKPHVFSRSIDYFFLSNLKQLAVRAQHECVEWLREHDAAIKSDHLLTKETLQNQEQQDE
jgi:hypothetical protein